MKDLLKKYKDTKKIAETEVAGDLKTRPGREGMRRQAKVDLVGIEKEVATAFKKAGFPVFVEGPNFDGFVTIAKQMAETIPVDFGRALEPLRKAVEATLSGKNREFSPSSFAAMVREFRDLGAGLGMTSIPAASYEGPEYLSDEAATARLVDRYLSKYMGSDMVAAIIERQALNGLLDIQDAGPVVPVLIRGIRSDLQESVSRHLFQGKFVTAEASSDIDEDAVTKTFKAVRAARK